MSADQPSPAAPGAGSEPRPATWRFLVPLLIFAALVAVFGLTLWKIKHGLDIHEIKSPLIGRRAPQFDLPSLNEPGKRISNASYAGRPYLVNVWGTWCGGCRQEHPTLVELARETTVPMLGLDWKDDHAEARTYLAQLGNPYQAVVSDDDGRTAIDFGVYGAPETFLVSADGVVLVKQIGMMTRADWEKRFLPHLGRSGATP